MSGEQKPNLTPETVQSHLLALMEEKEKRYLDRFSAQEKSSQAALLASDNAKNFSERTNERWKESANEWRGAMTDREKNFAKRSDLENLKERLDLLEGARGGTKDTWGRVLAVIAVVVSLLAIIWNAVPK